MGAAPAAKRPVVLAMPASLKPSNLLQYREAKQPGAVPWIAAPQEEWLSGMKKGKSGKRAAVDGFKVLFPIFIFKAFEAAYSQCAFAAYPLYLARLGGSLEWSGMALSCGKFGALAFALSAPMVMRAFGILRGFYLSLFIGCGGITLLIIGYFMESKVMTLIGLLGGGAFAGMGMILFTYIQVNIPVRQQALLFWLTDIYMFAGILSGPIIMMFLKTEALQILVPFAILASSSWGLLITYLVQYGFDASKFSRPIQQGRATGFQCTFPLICIAFLALSFIGLVSGSLFGTLASLVCKATYNWNPSDLGMLTLPYMLSIAATLLAFPVLVSYFTFTQLLTLVMAEACLGLACIQFPMYPAVPPWRMVLGMCLTGANEKLGQFLPNIFLAASVDTATFAQFVSFILLVDGIIGIFTPTACMWLFANTPAGIWTATFLGSFVITMNMFYTMGVTSIAYSSPLRAAFSGTTKMKM